MACCVFEASAATVTHVTSDGTDSAGFEFVGGDVVAGSFVSGGVSEALAALLTKIAPNGTNGVDDESVGSGVVDGYSVAGGVGESVPVPLSSNVTETDGIRVSGTLKASGDEVFAVTVACWSNGGKDTVEVTGSIFKTKHRNKSIVQ